MSKRVHFSKQPVRTVGKVAVIKGSKKTKKKAETKIVKKPEWNVCLAGWEGGGGGVTGSPVV